MGIQTLLGLCTISQDVPLLIQTTVCGPIFLAPSEIRPWILFCMVERRTPYILLAPNIVDVPFVTSIKAHFRDTWEYICVSLFYVLFCMCQVFTHFFKKYQER